MNDALQLYAFDSPIGRITLAQKNEALVWLRHGEPEPAEPPLLTETPLLLKAAQELTEYFAGQRQVFDLPLAPEGTPFQQRVWMALRQIPYGKTVSYATLAKMAGNPRAVRAVGGANGKNPLMILIPCHRVIAADGRLGGFSGGLDTKRFLLKLENVTWKE